MRLRRRRMRRWKRRGGGGGGGRKRRRKRRRRRTYTRLARSTVIALLGLEAKADYTTKPIRPYKAL